MSDSQVCFRGRAGLSGFHDAVTGSLVQQEVLAATEDRFEARLRTGHVSRIGLVEASFTPLRSRRTAAGAPDDGSVFVLLPARAKGRLVHRHGIEPVTPGHVVVVPAAESFDVSYAGSSRVLFVELPGDVRRERFAALSGPVMSTVLGTVARGLVGTLPQSARALGRAAPPERAAVEARVETLVTAVLDLVLGDLHERSASLRAAAESVVRARLTDPDLGVETLAQALAISPRTLHRAFEQSGTTVGAHIRHERLARARLLLRDRPDLTSTAVGHEVGFGSTSAFTRAFRELTGRTPREERESISRDGTNC